MAALAAGVRSSSSLSTLNMRRFHLGRDAPAVTAALASKPRLLTLRLVEVGLRAEPLQRYQRLRHELGRDHILPYTSWTSS